MGGWGRFCTALDRSGNRREKGSRLLLLHFAQGNIRGGRPWPGGVTPSFTCLLGADTTESSRHTAQTHTQPLHHDGSHQIGSFFTNDAGVTDDWTMFSLSRQQQHRNIVTPVRSCKRRGRTTDCRGCTHLLSLADDCASVCVCVCPGMSLMGCEENADRSDPEAAPPCVSHVTPGAIYGRLPGPSVGPHVHCRGVGRFDSGQQNKIQKCPRLIFQIWFHAGITL